MENIMISDVTISQSKISSKDMLTFRESLELSKMLDLLHVSLIELNPLENVKVDSLKIKSVASLVNNSIVAVPVSLFPLNADTVWSALSHAKKPRLQVAVPVSTVQMEYIYHKKPDAILKAVTEAVAVCKGYTEDVEFIAYDATRSEKDFLCSIIKAAIASGATTVTVSDCTGEMLPSEFSLFIKELYLSIKELQCVRLGVSVANNLSMADACVLAAVSEGAREIKASAIDMNVASLEHVASLISKRGDAFLVESSILQTELKKRIGQMKELCLKSKENSTPFEDGVQENQNFLTNHDDKVSLIHMAESLGYDLSKEDMDRVWDAFSDIASHKEKISSRELEAIIASNAMQVPSAYQLVGYVLSSSNTHGSTAHIQMSCKGQVLEGLSLGDGPIDAAYLAIEQITGCHYELDDFQISAVTEGREAMGETVTKLRHNGKIYSGRGISTDINESGIHAYINALNKIVYEEEES